VFQDNKEVKDFYVPGETYILDDSSVVFEEMPEEYLMSKKLLPEWAYAEWNLPKAVNGEIGDGAEISPYRPWRRRAKQVIFEKLKMMPEQSQIYLKPGESEEVSEMPQPPTTFLDGVPNFEEVPQFLGNFSFGQVSSERGIWGELVSALTTAGMQILEAEKKKYEAEIEAYKKTVTPTQAPKAAGETTMSKILPFALIGGILYLVLKSQKKTKR